jgi:hypothetical protein
MNKKMMRIVTLAIAVIAFAWGIYEIQIPHKMVAMAAFALTLMALAVNYFGIEVFEKQHRGLSLGMLIFLFGFYAVMNEYKPAGTILTVDQTRYEVGAQLMEVDGSAACGSLSDAREALREAAKSCFALSKDKRVMWFGNKSVPPRKPADFGLTVPASQQPLDGCAAWVAVISEQCPTYLGALDQRSLDNLLGK